ncbi:putative solute carrier family 35 member E3 [Glonium stellatum]|uniref:GDP-mannose transporter n=1 Tax=Glonium stellatum TaxID=574774 RepID=A0A8E2F8V5_9PEZI|nr:putative solute carrier family 35 member E3 [Glonium stellatum]
MRTLSFFCYAIANNATQVFTNKQLFKKESFRYAQVTFAAFHFAVTSLTLWIASRPFVAIFQAKIAPTISILPLSTAMCLNVILPNLSLQYSSVTFYQIARVLLTPCVAALNFIISKTFIPQRAALTLIPVCVGVGMVSYFDALPDPGNPSKGTSIYGVAFSFGGVLCSALYTVWVASYHKKLQMSSMQLLLNQAPTSVLLLLYVIPFSDDVSVWTTIPLPMWLLIFLSGLCACVISLSQLIIINEAGPVSSTVVGHLKTCCIVGFGWVFDGRSFKDGSLIGIILAICGIIS